jgi:hypothetical protein
MAKFRKGADAPDRPPVKSDDKPGTSLPRGAIPIYAGGVRRGHVSGNKATAATVARFGVRNAKVGTVDGKPAWVGENDADVRRRQELQRAQRVKNAKGSVSFHPTRPDKPTRPERGG